MKIFTTNLIILLLLSCSLCQHTIVYPLHTPTKNTTSQTIASRLTNESYISPEMQWEVLSVLPNPAFELNLKTGSIDNLPTPAQLLQIISRKLQSTNASADKDAIKNALRTMLEATEIALFVAKIEGTFASRQGISPQVYEHVIALLQLQKTSINTLVNQIPNSYVSWFWGNDQSSAVAPKLTQEQIIQQGIQTNQWPISFNPSDSTINIPARLVPIIIKNNDYKQKLSPAIAANLLFQECFIAQQHHLKHKLGADALNLNLQSPISEDNYIYSSFPDFYEICENAKNYAVASGLRSTINDFVTAEQAAAHTLLLHTRQAVQTALYIANKKSGVNIGYLLPASVVSYLDGIVGQLLQYDAILEKLCQDAQYGATIQDSQQAAQWSTITKIAAGVIVTGATVATLHFFAPTVLPTIAQTGYGYGAQAATVITDSVMNWWNGTGQNALPQTPASAAKIIATSAQQTQPASTKIEITPKNKDEFPEGFLTPVQLGLLKQGHSVFVDSNSLPGNQNNQNQLSQNQSNAAIAPPAGPAQQNSWFSSWNTTNQSNIQPKQSDTTTPPTTPDQSQPSDKKTPSPVISTFNTVANIGKTASMLGNVAGVLGHTIASTDGDPELSKKLQYWGQQASLYGSIAGGLTGQIGDIGTAVGTASSFVPGQVGAIGKAAGSTLGATGALYDLYNAGTPGITGMAGINAGMSTMGAITSVANARKVIQNSTSSNPQIRQAAQNNDNTAITMLNPQEIFVTLQQIIDDAVAKAADIVVQLKDFIVYTLTNRMVTPAILIEMIQYLQSTQYAQNPSAQQQLNQVIEKLRPMQKDFETIQA